MRRIRPDKAEAEQELLNSSTLGRASRRRTGWWKKYVLGLGGLLLACILLAPLLLQSTTLVLALAQRSGMLEPMQLDIEGISFGWFRPLRVQGLVVNDAQGKQLGRIETIESELSLWRLLTQRSDLGTILVEKLDSNVEVHEGTTNIEQIVQQWLAQFKPQPEEDQSTSEIPKVTLVLKDSVIHAVDQLTQEAWDLEIRQAVVEVDSSRSTLPKVAVAGKLVQRHPATGVAGQFVIKIQEAGSAKAGSSEEEIASSKGANSRLALQTSAELQTMPVMWLSLVKRRFPSSPIESGAGWISLKADGTLEDAEHWKINVSEGTLAQLAISAPSLIGAQPASMQQANWSGTWQLAGNKLTVTDNRLNCDFGEASGTASLPWPLTPPAPTTPWIANGEFDIRGKVDLPKLLEVAPSLVPIKDNMVLMSGAADLQMQQKLDSRGLPQSRYVLTLGDLEANIQGQSIRWNDALAATMQVQPDAAGDVRFQGEVKAEFCDFQAAGSLDGGRISGQVNLQQLKKRLDEFVTLPLEQVDGSADGTISWERQADGLVKVTGDVQTTPILLRAAGGELTEPAWRGQGNVDLRLVNNKLQRLDRGHLRLQSNHEEAIVDIFEPITLPTGDLTTGENKASKLPPASARLKFVGDLAAWQRRVMLLQTWSPDIALRGKLDLEATAVVDASHIELTKASWMAEPLEIRTPQFNIAEPRMKGEFQGRVDSQNITRLEIASLEVQAASFALRAADNVIANDPNGGRQGAGAFRINLANLTSSLNTSTAVSSSGERSRPEILSPGNNSGMSGIPATTQPWPLRLSGEIIGNANWTVTKQGLAWKLTADGTDILAEQVVPRGTSPGNLVSTTGARGDLATSKIWEETRLRTGCSGTWDAATGKITLTPTEVASDWIAYAGGVTIDSKHATELLNVDGRFTYDAAKVTERIEPWTANWITLEGQRTEPLKVVLSKVADKADSLTGLNVTTQLGWERAKAIGLNIGPAEIPVSVDRGILKTASSIPINKGKVDFDLTADLTAQPLKITQKPGNVLTNVDITPEMYQGWLQYVTPLVAKATSAEGELSLIIDRAELVPADLKQQNIAGKVIIHKAAIGPGPLSTSILQLVQYVNAIRSGDMNAATTAIPLAGSVLNTLVPGVAPGAPATAATAQPALANQWLQLNEQSIEFAVENGRVIHREFAMQVGDVQVKSSGAVSIDGGIEMLVSVPIQEDWIKKQAYLQPLAGRSIDIPVRGTLNEPQVDWRSIATLTTNLAAGTAMQAGQNALQRELNKQLQKLPLDRLEKPFETLDKLFAPIRQP